MTVVKEGPDCGLTREVLIEEVAKGETLSSIERAWGMKYNTIHNWVKKWELKGINQAKAQILLEEAKLAKPMVVREKEMPPKDNVQVEVSQQMNEMLVKEKEALQKELQELRHSYSASENARDNLLRERDEYRMAVDELSEQVASHDEMLNLLNRTKSRLSDLEKEHEDLLIQMEQQQAATEAIKSDPNSCYETLVELGALQEPADPVNHPLHYNRGGIECIDAIEAATSGLSGPEAYNTGEAIKYLWRWKWRNGREDLQKANWYINRLIGGE
ncbi:DUF3310 domain-containing protein [Paenibacillus chibensis]|uniref:DUF3310 domain-containing protein n=1 Tax=Paenibacillus chibensis TaxID=59846 RepID=A0ABU6PWX9_9BACL|nr:DUF3310 domain-containing protein [Paenibacillus chibensis]